MKTASEQQTAGSTLAPAGEWTLDPALSTVGFRIRKFLWRPKGRFRDISGTLVVGDRQLDLSASAAAESISTGVRPRDLHLRSSHFFDTKRHSSIDLNLSEATPLAGGAYRLRGELTLKGVTRPVELIAAAHAHDDHLHVHAEGSIDRRAHGLVAPAFVEMGGLMLGREVEVDIDALFRRES